MKIYQYDPCNSRYSCVLSTAVPHKEFEHEFSFCTPIAELLQPGLSPVFHISNPVQFNRFQLDLSDETASHSLPLSTLSTDSDTITFAFPSSSSRSSFSFIPALATRLGFVRFQTWQPEALLTRRHAFSAHQFWRRRLCAYLSLPVVTVKHTPDSFHSRLELAAASIGRGVFIVDEKLKGEFRFKPSSMKTMKSLKDRFGALEFVVSTTELSDFSGACVTERALFAGAFKYSFPNVSRLLQATFVDSGCRPVWRNGASAWPGGGGDDVETLRDLLFKKNGPALGCGYAVRCLKIDCYSGELGMDADIGNSVSDEWIVVTEDKEEGENDGVEGVALVAVIRRGVVKRSAVVMLGDVKTFLEASAVVDIGSMIRENDMNGGSDEADEVMERLGYDLVDAQVISGTDFVSSVRIVSTTEDVILNARLQASPSRRSVMNSIQYPTVW